MTKQSKASSLKYLRGIKMNEIKLTKENNCIYLTQDLWGMNLYQRTKAIEKFVKNETKILEYCVDNELKAIFNRNGIIVLTNDESVLNRAFDMLNAKGISIDIKDLFKNKKIYKGVVVGTSNNEMTVVLEDDRYIQCGVEIIVKGERR